MENDFDQYDDLSLGQSLYYDSYPQRRFVFARTECCNPVVDLLTLLSTLGAIAAATFLFRQLAIDNIMAGGRRKRSSLFNQGRKKKFLL